MTLEFYASNALACMYNIDRILIAESAGALFLYRVRFRIGYCSLQQEYD